MLRSGHAWHYKAYAQEQPSYERKAFAEAEEQARAEKIGVWSDGNPVAPWDYKAGLTNQSALTIPKEFPIIGNKNAMIYHEPNCRDYHKIAGPNRVYFRTGPDAEKAGFRKAKNC